jgi:hypothetical protein
MMRLLRPSATHASRAHSRARVWPCGPTRATHASHPHGGIFLRSFPLHSAHYARETIAEICSPWGALATAIMTQTGS